MAESSSLRGWTFEPSPTWPLDLFDMDLSPHPRGRRRVGRARARRTDRNGHSPGHDSRLRASVYGIPPSGVNGDPARISSPSSPSCGPIHPGRGVSGTRAALTIATMPALIASGKSGQAVATVPISPLPPGVSSAYQPPDSPRDWRVPTPKSPQKYGRCAGPVFAPFKNGRRRTSAPMYCGGNPASNACMYRYRRDTESEVTPTKPFLDSSFPSLIY